MDVLNREVPLYMYIPECNRAFMGTAKKRLKKFVFSSNFVHIAINSVYIQTMIQLCTVEAKKTVHTEL